jgi:hypothetical protein
MLRDVVFQQMLDHPLPWRIESDWTEEVTASDGHIVAKSDHSTAQAIIALAEQIRAELDESSEQFKKEMKEEDNGTNTSLQDVTSGPSGT